MLLYALYMMMIKHLLLYRSTHLAGRCRALPVLRLLPRQRRQLPRPAAERGRRLRPGPLRIATAAARRAPQAPRGRGRRGPRLGRRLRRRRRGGAQVWVALHQALEGGVAPGEIGELRGDRGDEEPRRGEHVFQILEEQGGMGIRGEAGRGGSGVGYV